MGEKLYRAQILLRAEQHRKLAMLSRDEGKSISEIARSLIDEALRSHQGPVWDNRTRILGGMRDLRERIGSRVGTLRFDPVGESRTGREEERPWHRPS